MRRAIGMTVGLGGAALGASATGLLGGSAWLAYRLTHPRARVDMPGVRLLDWSPAAPEEVEFASRDGIRLRGWFLTADGSDDVVILCHGYGGNRFQVHDMALALWRRGHNVLSFDFRASGESEGRLASFGFREGEDVLGAVDYAVGRREVRDGRVAVVGFSMGATAALLAAARDERIRCVVADSAYPSLRDVLKGAFRHFAHAPSFPFAALVVRWGQRFLGTKIDRIRPGDIIASISPRPVYLIHGERDPIIPPVHAERLYEAAAEPKRLWIAPAAGHAMAGIASPLEFISRVEGFIRDSLD